MQAENSFEIRTWQRPEYHPDQITGLHAYIQIAPDSIHLILADKAAQSTVWLQEIRNPYLSFNQVTFETLKEIPGLLAFATATYQSKTVILRDERCMLVPDELVTISECELFYAMYQPVLPESQVLYCRLHFGQITALFNVSNELLKFIRFECQADDVIHGSLLFIKALALQTHTDVEHTLFVQVHSGYLEMVALQNGALRFYNRYGFNSPTEAMYFIQLVAENLGIQEQLFLVVFGAIHNSDALYDLLHQYSKRIMFGERYPAFTWPEDLVQTGPHTYFTETACLLCE